MEYKFKYRRVGDKIWNGIMVEGHQYDNQADRMKLFLADQCIHEIANWKNCDLILDKNCAKATKAFNDKQDKS